MAAFGSAGERWCAVTGGRGFAARHLVEMLLRSQEWCVRIADLGPSINLEPHEETGVLGDALKSGRAAYVSADLRLKPQVFKAFDGVEAVFHMAAPDSSINNFQLHFSVNVEGTKNVIDSCIECKVKRLIYTSSPSVVFDGIHGICNGKESMPYPVKFNDSYSETKAAGEKLIISANGKNGLLTCCIRPSSIFGPGDRLLVPSLVAAARAGKSKFIIGDGNNLYDFTYVENVAYAHICAERTLAAGGAAAATVAGQAYFITNVEPIKFWEFMSLILEGLGYERPRIKIAASLMMPIAHVVELTYKLFSRYGMSVPQLTPSRVRLLSCERTFSCSKAKEHIAYEPIVSLKDGLKKTIDSYQHLRAKQQKRTSKVYTYLGNESVANTLLWKDKKQTLTTVLFLVAIYYYFFASGYTLITAIAKLLSMLALFLFVHGLLPTKILAYKIEKMPPSYFQLSEEKAHQFVSSISSSWNSLVGILRSLCKGRDWSLFLKVFIILLLVSFLGAIPMQSSYKIGFPALFIGFYMYEKWEEEIDGAFDKARLEILKLKSNAKKKFARQ
ncbi:3beta-hydroxysteroid-dehydrogenase/decarboxylase isoform X1 [Dendrobium catenatum]|uniref:3beta-hydroxysteroid-dehydrogenase/decarboxylase isoform X1 n=1 Tax=Dendrobium catenatum TaxID=906689 RepID=UPI0009F1F93E|nr:3beta-hydroxysteroid-dehydrogenase/decarboxylase isoform X1 [Dendrobium catenatum]